MVCSKTSQFFCTCNFHWDRGRHSRKKVIHKTNHDDLLQIMIQEYVDRQHAMQFNPIDIIIIRWVDKQYSPQSTYFRLKEFGLDTAEQQSKPKKQYRIP